MSHTHLAMACGIGWALSFQSVVDVDPIAAINNGDLEQLRQYLATASDVNEPIGSEGTLLTIAAFAEGPNHADMVEAILKAGGAKGITWVDEQGRSALHHAADTRSIEAPRVIEILIEAGAKVNEQDRGGMTPLMLLVSDNPLPSAVDELLRAGAKVDVRDKRGNTALHWAAGFRQELRDARTIMMLIEHGADVDARNADGWTPVMAAALSPGTDPMTMLLMQDEDGDRTAQERVNDALPNGWTPLMLAVASVKPQIWHQWLVQIAGPLGVIDAQLDDNAEAQNEDLQMAAGMYSEWARFGNVGRVWALLASGADTNRKTKDGTSVQSLLENRDDLEARAIRALLDVAQKQ